MGSPLHPSTALREAYREPVRPHAILGWGLFNVIEGTLDPEILQVHHVYQNGHHLLPDAVFLAVGACFLLAGPLAIRKASARPHSP